MNAKLETGQIVAIDVEEKGMLREIALLVIL